MTRHTPMPELPDIEITKPEVFIMETLYTEDEAANRGEGQALMQLLRMSGMNPKYYYFQEEAELPYLVHLFRQSQYRYLHFSSHGGPTEIYTTNGRISYIRFAQIFKRHLALRRLFVSACELGNDLFTEVLAGSNKGMQSIVAPVNKISFHTAAAIWNVLYLSLFEAEAKGMTHRDIIERLAGIRRLFPVDFHFSGYNPRKDNWRYLTINKGYISKGLRIRPEKSH